MQAMRLNKYLSIIIIIALLVPLALSGCAKSGGKTIKVGVIAPMTGDVKTFGESTKEGAQLAIEEWNTKGGINGKKVEMVLGDDKGDAAEASNAGTKMIKQDGIKFIVGSVQSKCSIPISAIANDNKVIMITGTSTNGKVTVDPWPGGTRKAYVFRACFIDDFQGPAMARFAIDTVKAKKAAVLYDNGNDYVKGLAENFKAAFTKLGGTINVYEAYSLNDSDFSALLTKVLADKPDFLYLPDYYNKVNLIAKQAKDKGFAGVMGGADGWDSPDLDLKVVEGGYFTNHYSAEDPRPIVQDFVKAYSTKYKTSDGKNKVPDALATLAYDATNTLLNAIKTAGSEDTTKVKDALQSGKFTVVSGIDPISFDANGNPSKEICMIQIKGGALKFGGLAKP
jgi:branched-chain amino acid transport system substrate-binding protein